MPTNKISRVTAPPFGQRTSTQVSGKAAYPLPNSFAGRSEYTLLLVQGRKKMPRAIMKSLPLSDRAVHYSDAVSPAVHPCAGQ